ncbi:MAG: 50S ribosomal protein L24 [Clostridiaceae bacterium]|jgi:large subunit ribosomal protein L24|nr:50S ribosomal protein L24 [Clostridiaceae bacterium]
MNKKMHVKKGDTIVVLSGKDKGKKGKVLTVIPKKESVIVEGIAMAVKHKKPRKAGDEGGLINQETAIKVCKVMLSCPKCGRSTRIGRQVLESGEIVRVCKRCAEII